jgi:hypothetical protein
VWLLEDGDLLAKTRAAIGKSIGMSAGDYLTIWTVRGIGMMEVIDGGVASLCKRRDVIVCLSTYVPGFWSVKGLNSTVLMLILL